jgi:preprotein translocase subunit SecD
LARGVSLSDGSLRVVPLGTLVLEASSPGALDPVELSSPAARFFVLRDQPSLSGAGLTNPRASTDQSGSPDVGFAFTPRASRDFQRATARISRRGSSVSTGAISLDQHFAIALDGRLLTVPSIDYRTFPEGIVGDNGADITAGFTPQAARDLALVLRYGPLPATLRPAG